MKKVIIVLIGLLLFSSGKCSGPEVNEEGREMFYEVDREFTEWQVDSACRSEGLPLDLELWLSGTVMRDYETEEGIYQWLFIQNDSTAFILSELSQDKYKFKKRVLREVKK